MKILGIGLIVAAVAGCDGASRATPSPDGGVIAGDDGSTGQPTDGAAPDTREAAMLETGSVCGKHDGFGPAIISVDVAGPAGGVYDGPAVVERSTADGLILYFESSATDGGPPTAWHAKLSVPDTVPTMPLGTKVWLSKHPAGNLNVPPYQRQPGWWLSVREHEAGTLLFGAAMDESSVTEPIAATVGAATCTDHNPLCSSPEATITYQVVEVQGDVPVTIEDSQVATVAIAGVPYQVRVTAHRESAPSFGCGIDYFPENAGGLALDVQAQDLKARIANLEQGAPPSCAQGNAPSIDAGFELYGVSASTRYDGPVVYEHQVGSSSWMFSVPGLTPVPVELGVQLRGVPFVEPPVGTKLWATLPQIAIGALRESQQGPLIVASAYTLSAPLQEPAASQLAQIFGVAVSAAKSCDYAAPVDEGGSPTTLWDLAFDTVPPVRVQSGELGKVQLGGKDYAVWVWGERFMTFVVYAL
jgi:hypothetical protein